MRIKKRRRRPTDPIEAANKKDDEAFIAAYLQPSMAPIFLRVKHHQEKPASQYLHSVVTAGYRTGRTRDAHWTRWTHPQTGAKYTITLTRSTSVSEIDLDSCFHMIEETSRPDYENSTVKWQADKKLKEMMSADLRYVLVKDESGQIRAFTSLMPTYELGQPVVYCYEIHLKPELRGTGLASQLLEVHAAVARHLPPINKVMLTCFVANKRGLAFYEKEGFVKDDISPEPRHLRQGKTVEPDYVILSKRVGPGASSP